MILLLAACVPDDFDGWDTDPDPIETGDPPDTDVGSDPAIVGTWTSAGGDLSELFANEPFSYVSVTGTFRSGGAYDFTVVTADDEAEVSGRYALDLSTDPPGITLSQTSPYEATASGIWSVAGDTLTYEVVQTDPDYGFSPPTPQAGFGSTSGPNLDAGVNVQVYRR